MLQRPTDRLERRLGFTAAVLSGLGVTIGAGIYVLIGSAAGNAGNAVWLSFILAAVAATFTGLSYARLVKFRPKDAPEFHYVGAAFGKRLGFLAGWLMLWSMIVSGAVVSLGFAAYLRRLVDIPEVPAALAVVGMTTLVVLAGIRQSVTFLGTLTLPALLGLVAIIIVGVPYIGNTDLLEAPRGLSGIWGAAALVFYAYLGFEATANLAEEMKNPEKELPRAMLTVLAVTALLYVLVAVASVSVVGWEDLNQSSAPVSEVAARSVGTEVGALAAIVSMGATGSTALFLILAASRSVWSMSCAGALPLPFCSIGQRRTPWVAIVGVGVLAGLFVFVRDLETVALFTNIAVLLSFAAVNAAVIKLRNHFGPESKTKRVIYGVILPAAGIISCLWLGVNTSLQTLLFGVALVIAGLVVFQVFSSGKTVTPEDQPLEP